MLRSRPNSLGDNETRATGEMILQTKMSNDRMVVLCAMHDLDWQYATINDLAQRWGVTPHLLRYYLRKYRTTGMVPVLRGNVGRPKQRGAPK